MDIAATSPRGRPAAAGNVQNVGQSRESVTLHASSDTALLTAPFNPLLLQQFAIVLVKGK
jgi:hypothetical protein